MFLNSLAYEYWTDGKGDNVGARTVGQYIPKFDGEKFKDLVGKVKGLCLRIWL